MKNYIKDMMLGLLLLSIFSTIMYQLYQGRKTVENGVLINEISITGEEK